MPAFEGKIRWTLEQLNATPPDSINASRRHVLVLLKLRDELAHGKPISYSGSKTHPVTEEPPPMERPWVEERTTLPKARRYVNAVRIFCDWLDGKAAGRIVDPYLRHGAFGGVHQSQLFSASVLSRTTRPPVALRDARCRSHKASGRAPIGMDRRHSPEKDPSRES